MDVLTMFASLRPDSEVLSTDERAALRMSLFGSSADGSGTDPALDAPPSIADDPESTLIALEQPRPSGPRRRSRRVTHGLLAIAVAAAVVTTLVLISRDHTTAPADTPLEEPSRDEIAAASNEGVYVPGTGPTEVTATRSYVSLRTCGSYPGADVDPDCDGPKGWAYVTGSVDGPGVHYGLLGFVDDLVLSALDDRFFVASSASLSQDPPSAPAAWLIDSVTGQRGPLTWEDEPTTLNSAEQLVALFPAHSIPWDTDSGERFLPRVVDRRDWTVRPMRVPDDATAALRIHQPGAGRIWIGIAPDGGEVGLAYTDDGGASWTNVAVPEFVRPTSEELASVVPGGDELVVATTGDHIAVTQPWGGYARPVYVSADTGENWNSVRLDSDGNGRKLFVLPDDRLMLVQTWDLMGTGSLLVSSTSSDWSQLEEDVRFESLAGTNSMVDAYQHGLVVIYARSVDVVSPLEFSTDLTDWWTIPGLDFCADLPC